MTYPMVRRPEHPRADMLGFVPLHIIIAEEKLCGGKHIPKGIVVHHKNWHKTSNPEDGSNYELMTRAEHQKLPYWQGRFLAEHGLLDRFFEYWREKKDQPNPYDLELELERKQQLLARKERKLARLRKRSTTSG